MHQDRQLAAIMFTDIVGYTSLMEKDEGEALYLLEINRQIIQEMLKAYNGHYIKEIGDGTLSIFKSTLDALSCARKILKLIVEYPKLNLRISLHLGDIIQEDKDVFGDGVNIAARLEPLAPCNGIAISQHFYAQIQGKTSHNFQSIGFPTLKNITVKIEVFIWDPKIHPNQRNCASKQNDKVTVLASTLAVFNYKIIVVSLLIIIGSYFLWQQHGLSWNSEKNTQIESNGVDINSIAVLKFNNIGDLYDNQYFNEGLSEELLNLLARIKELRVVSRTSTWALPENVSSAMVREQLNVNYMVEGSVRKSNDEVRITVQLIDTQTGFHLWSETYDRKLDDVFAIQDEIALKITSALKLLLSAQSIKAISTHQKVDAMAYEYYLKAKHSLRQPKTKTTITRAIKFFNSALVIEDNFELAKAGLCQSKVKYYQLTMVKGDFENAEKNCLAILSANNYQSEIYIGLGNLYLVSGQLTDAEKNFQAALTLNLSSTDALLGLAYVAEKGASPENADKYYQRAIRVDPNYSGAHEEYASYLFYQGHYAEAINEFKKVISLKPKYGNAYNSLGAAYFAKGDTERGIKVFQQSLTIEENHEAYSNLGTAFFMKKEFEKASQMYLQAVNLAPDDYLYRGFLAEAYERQPNKNEEMTQAYFHAIQKAEQAFEVNEKDNETVVSLAFYYVKVNNKDKALTLLQGLENEELLADLLYTMSISYLSLNDQVKALEYLTKAIKKGYDKKLALVDENFSRLQGNQQFKEIVNEE